MCRGWKSNGSCLGLSVVIKQCTPEGSWLPFIIDILGYREVWESVSMFQISWYKVIRYRVQEISLLSLLCASRHQKMCQGVSLARDWTIQKDVKAESTVIIWTWVWLPLPTSRCFRNIWRKLLPTCLTLFLSNSTDTTSIIRHLNYVLFPCPILLFSNMPYTLSPRESDVPISQKLLIVHTIRFLYLEDKI